ncbi:MAG TPA: type II toxin-antitoxin system prevent-host-death family antitoxin [Pyrinomonadaceae bacterium]|nr:type II toxin-antitoxin system prevent-host-death family antitoxin [Pyrinomonadaceae bacterium]
MAKMQVVKNPPSTSKKLSKLTMRRNVGRHEIRRGLEASYTATEAKNEFGHVLEQAIQGITVLITKHHSPRAVLISMDQFKALEAAHQLKLNTLTEQFDTLLERMQTPKARRGMAAAFGANNKQLGKAAVVAARKRGLTTASNTSRKKLGKSAVAAARKRA